MKQKGWKHGGIYILTKPVHVVVDPEYAKNIMVKDFDYFTDRGFFYDEKFDPSSAHLVFLGGQNWNKIRSVLNPFFSPSKMKNIFPRILSSAEKMITQIGDGGVVDIHQRVLCYTINNAFYVVFGLESNVFEEKHSKIKINGEKLIRQSKFSVTFKLIATLFPKFGQIFRVRMYPKDESDFFQKLTRDCIDYRKRNCCKGNDMIQLLMDHEEHPLTIEEIVAQCQIFFLGAFETSSSTLTFALYELAKNQILQDKARGEIETVLENYEGKITYESLHSLKYLNQVVQETTRKYPPALTLTRKCVKDYKIPNENKIIEKGILVIIPIYAIHHDQEHYPDPEKFDPERFSQRQDYTFLGFGDGPRMCIGKRLGFMQVKIGLATLLKRYKFTVNKNTTEPLTIGTDSFITAPATPVWLNMHKLK